MLARRRPIIFLTVNRAGRILIALAYFLAQAYSLGHEAFEQHAADCCPADGLARLECGDDCDQADHHHHRHHVRCAACVKSIGLSEPVGAVDPTVETAAEPISELRPTFVAAELGPDAPRAPPVAA